MATKVICDQCGNDITSKSPHRYTVYCPNDYSSAAQQQYKAAMQAQQQGLLAPAVLPPYNPTSSICFEVELCGTCKPIWLERVKRLTQASDPEN